MLPNSHNISLVHSLFQYLNNYFILTFPQTSITLALSSLSAELLCCSFHNKIKEFKRALDTTSLTFAHLPASAPTPVSLSELSMSLFAASLSVCTLYCRSHSLKNGCFFLRSHSSLFLLNHQHSCPCWIIPLGTYTCCYFFHLKRRSLLTPFPWQ